MYKSLPPPRIDVDPMVDRETLADGGRLRAIPSSRNELGLASAVHRYEHAEWEAMTAGRKQRTPSRSPSDELQATSDRLSARTEALNARTAALRTSSERLRAATERLREQNERAITS